MRSLLTLRTLRSAALGALLSLGAIAGSTREAGAQTITAAYAPSCGPGTVCGSLRFTVANAGPSLLELIGLRLSSANPAFAFLDLGGNAGTYIAVDALTPDGFTGDMQVIGGGSDLSIDFTASGLPFTVGAGGTGYVEVQLTGTPALQNGVFSYTADLPSDGRIAGNVTVAATSTVPEPSTYALLATGLGTLGLIARRRRAA
jgi:hypothetical protein